MVKYTTITAFFCLLGIIFPSNGASAGLLNDWLRQDRPAAAAWDLGGQFRVRYEVKENAGRVSNLDFLEGADNSNDFFLFRVKTHVGWAPESWMSVFVEGRDSHDASDRRLVKETDTFDLYQAYIRLGDPKIFPVTLLIGRQALGYGDERYVGVSDWSNVGRSFDVVKAHYENGAVILDAFSGRIVIPYDEHFNVANDYDWFSGVYSSTKKVIPWQQTDLFFLARNVSAQSPAAIAPGLGGPGARDIYTVGTLWRSLPGKFADWEYSIEAAAQFGRIAAPAGGLEQRAFAVNVSGGYEWREAPGEPRILAGYDFGSGDSNPSDSRNETMELVFGTNHRPYGLADLTGMRNLHIPHIGGSIKPLKNLTLWTEWLGFWMVESGDYFFPESGGGRSGNGYGRHPTFNSYVGNELDLNAVWKVTSWGHLQAGYAHFFIGDYIRQSAATGSFKAGDADWAYLQVAFNF